MKGNDEAYKYGVELPPGFRVHSMSLIIDPADKFASIGSETPNRALLLLAYISHNELASSRIEYALYQLQVILPSEKQERVLTRIVAHGQLPMELGSLNASYAEIVTGIFLAGGSFLFNLDMDNDDLGKIKIPDFFYFIIRLFGLILCVVIRCDKIREIISL